MSDTSFSLHYTHHHEPVPGQGSQVRLTGVHPYLRLTRGAQTLYAKGGQVVGADGLPVSQIPEWFWEEARKATPAARAEVRLRLPEDAPLPSETVASPARKPPTQVLDGPLLWACPECGKEMLPRQRGFHSAGHTRAKKKAVQVVGVI